MATQAGQEVRRVATRLTERLTHDDAALRYMHSKIATQIARLAQTTHTTRPVATAPLAMRPTKPQATRTVKRHAGISIGRTRLGIGIGYIMLLVLVWWLATPANAIFFGGCGLVLMSAIYVAITNHILDTHDIEDQMEGNSRPLHHPTKEDHFD